MLTRDPTADFTSGGNWMTRTIILPLDGSPLAERAFAYAEVLARDLPARVVLLRAVLSGSLLQDPTRPPEEVQEAHYELQRVAARLQRAGVEAEWCVINDEGGWAIISAAAEQDADLIVMSTRARGALARSFLGSVGDRVMRDAAAPVLLVPQAVTFNWPPAPRGLRIVLAIDGSAVAERAAAPAADLAKATGGEIILVHAVQPPVYSLQEERASEIFELTPAAARAHEALVRLSEDLASVGVRVTMEERIGLVADTILAVAQEHSAHLIAMATHGRSGPSRVVMGSEADAVLHRTRLPLVLCGPHFTPRDEAALPEDIPVAR
jgi:nucleotide-binding universal stress UspA family protein